MIVGEGPEFKNIKKKITILNLKKSENVFGFYQKKKLDEIWSKTDVLIMPSKVEGFWISIY